jgi:hypothetical protein
VIKARAAGPTDKQLIELVAIRQVLKLLQDVGVKADPTSLERDGEAVLDLAAKCVGIVLQRKITTARLKKMMNRHLKEIGAEIRGPTRQ